MGKNLFFSSTSEYSGKSFICLGVALKLKEMGYSVGYFKPFGIQTRILEDGRPEDDDVLLMKHVLNLEEESDVISPFKITDHYTVKLNELGKEHVLEKIKQSYKQISDNYDIVVIEAHGNPSFGLFMKLSPPSLAKELDTRPILVTKPPRIFPEAFVDEIISAKRAFVIRELLEPLGVILNQRPPNLDDSLLQYGRNLLQEYDVMCLGIIPEVKDLINPTVRDILTSLGNAKLLNEVSDAALHNTVSKWFIAAMQLSAAMSYFRKYPRKLVITGGDRTDILVGALETDTAAIILTGNLYPEQKVVTLARQRDVPLIMVPYDTLTTVENLNTMFWRIDPQNTPKITLAKKIVEEHLDFDKILEFVGKK